MDSTQNQTPKKTSDAKGCLIVIVVLVALVCIAKVFTDKYDREHKPDYEALKRHDELQNRKPCSSCNGTGHYDNNNFCISCKGTGWD